MTIESKTQRKFKKNLISKLPFFPNDKETLSELEGQSLDNVMFHYLHWSTRQIPRRARKVSIYPELTSDERYKSLKTQIKALRAKVSKGEDLSPFLSLRAHKKGYTPKQRIINGEVDSWEDKDQILNTKGFHHFHLDMTIQSSGLSVRTDEVLFAKVTRTEFHAIALFGHSVFESPKENGEIEEEWKRMWDIHEKYTTLGMKPGTTYISNPITTSGHPVGLRIIADSYMKIIEHFDSRLSERDFVNELYSNAKMEPPARYKLEWEINALDLILRDSKCDVSFILEEGFL